MKKTIRNTKPTCWYVSREIGVPPNIYEDANALLYIQDRDEAHKLEIKKLKAGMQREKEAAVQEVIVICPSRRF